MSNTTQTKDKPETSEQSTQQKPTVLEEDDEFEDFPVEDWPQEETEQANGNNVHLWEESWDDDDAAEDFSKQLKYVCSKRCQSSLSLVAGGGFYDATSHHAPPVTFKLSLLTMRFAL
ncbi:hypothetical protein KXW98_000851 [Aspergillus fumigatus]|uniref:26S proteasome complex subunit SEM1 n=1 Tax=Aspergillus fumigatus TaxID=746128 RepID=A0A229WJ91_ASPFM|nr:hypothetical protein CNMCM8057_000570 [Aspergillus fumigatus]KAF4266920.1 hypothetical protein CNMCM8714_004338 [Aspergillus fumigatus]KAF4271549.1 hypothetical protein CNMCM8812_000427 [Aspergillus fumigatus]KAF4280877.1 hypothetical protein CNMCM8689_001426 [Aspergillus fumigatus]KAF4292558.1 hypothetical protein CNMCM8686_007344 [Aspergillus fumigatus]